MLLADAAQDDGTGKMNALGLGWTKMSTPTPPMSVIFFADLDAGDLGRPHKVVCSLRDESGVTATLPGTDDGVSVDVELPEVSAADMSEGPLRISMVIQVGPGMPLRVGAYRWVAEVDGVESGEVEFAVLGS